jgi:hypothetical protein
MTVPEEKKAGYITLKEAGERFGYSQDYLGQLIRKGKLEGKLVYSHVAWVTTPEAVEEYLAGNKKKKQGTEIADIAPLDPSVIAQSEEVAPAFDAIPSDDEPAFPSEPSRASRILVNSFRTILFFIIVFGIFVFYLLTTLIGSTFNTKTNVASASVIFSLPTTSTVSLHQQASSRPNYE